ncbi:MAG: hypothetical protein ACE5JS_17935 [Nitrospinota bacterium]
MNPYLSLWFAGLSLAGMGLAAWLGHFGFRRLAVRYGAGGLPPPPGVLRALFRTLLTLWLYLVGAMMASLAWRVWPEVSTLPSGAFVVLGAMGALASLYFLMRGY